MNKLLVSALVSMGLAAAAPSLLLAQSAEPTAIEVAQAQPGAQPQHRQRAFSMPSERVEARLAYIRTALKITDAQQPQWNAFADTLRKQASAMDKQVEAWRAQMGQRTKGQQPNAIARLERQQQLHAAAVTRLNERLAVQRPLYAALTDAQKQVADEVLAPRHGQRRFHQGGRHRMA